MILGDVCTRNCAYCAVAHGTPKPLDIDEPQRLAAAVAEMGLKHVVITSVDRDDLPNGGAEIFAACIAEIRRLMPETSVEVLIPDFKGNPAALRIIVDAKPDILNHNLETIARLYRIARPGGRYARALELLEHAKEMNPELLTKSGLICGLGEDWDELLASLRDLRAARVDIITLGQYLRPSDQHLPIARWYTPDEFAELKRYGMSLGFRHVESGPLVRSSYHAWSKWRLRPHDRDRSIRQGHRAVRAASSDVAANAVDPSVRRKSRRSLRPGQDRRLLPPVHRTGSGGGRRAFRATR